MNARSGDRCTPTGRAYMLCLIFLNRLMPFLEKAGNPLKPMESMVTLTKTEGAISMAKKKDAGRVSRLDDMLTRYTVG